VLQHSTEDLAAQFLRRQGYKILARNWRLKLGELDLVVSRGSTLVFVEVKSRSRSQSIAPELAVDYRKQQKLRRLAEAYIAFRRPQFVDCRFDVIAVDGSTMNLRHIVDAF
jgi:putative endonuclease